MPLLNPVHWENVKNHVRVAVGDDQYDAWMATMQLEDYEADSRVVTIAVPSETHHRWLNRRYIPQLQEALSNELGIPVTVRLIVDQEEGDPITGSALGHVQPSREMDEFSGIDSPTSNFHVEAQPSPHVAPTFFDKSDRRRQISEPPRLNAHYLFSEFVVGESNRYAHAAAMAVSDPRSRSFNPLFIYGGSGLGKTHLMQAIGHGLYQRDNRLRVTYITSEQFINTFINAIQNKTHAEFRELYRSCDLLLIDDVQFLQGKERTQQEFFHTFNALYDAGKRVVVTSDRPPKELATLEERLRSRFEWGLLVDIQPPDLETRVAILRKKAQLEGVRLSSDVIFFIAERIKDNIREMEGALKRLHMAASIHDCQIDLARAREILGHLIIGSPQTRVSVEDIQRAVCEYFKLNLADLLGSGRSKRVSHPRHMAQYLSRKLTDLSFPDIAQKFGGKDHTSIIYAVRKVERDMENDPNVASIVNHLTKRVTRGDD